MNTRIYGQELPSKISTLSDNERLVAKEIINNINRLNKHYLISKFEENNFRWGGNLNYLATFKVEAFGSSIEINDIFIAYSKKSLEIQSLPKDGLQVPIFIEMIIPKANVHSPIFNMGLIENRNIKTYKFRKNGRIYKEKINYLEKPFIFSPKNYYKETKKSLKLNDSRFSDSLLIKECLSTTQKNDPYMLTKLLERDIYEDFQQFSEKSILDTQLSRKIKIKNFIESGFYSQDLSKIAQEIVSYNIEKGKNTTNSKFKSFVSYFSKTWNWVTKYIAVLGILFTAATFLIGGFSLLSTVEYDINITSYIFPKIPLAQIFFESAIILSIIILVYGLGIPGFLGLNALIQNIIFNISLNKPISKYRRKSFCLYSVIFSLAIFIFNFILYIIFNNNYIIVDIFLIFMMIPLPITIFSTSLTTWLEKIDFKGILGLIMFCVFIAVGAVGISTLWNPDRIQGGQFCRYTTEPYTDKIHVYRYLITQDWADKQEILILPGSDNYVNPAEYSFLPPYKKTNIESTKAPDLITVTKNEQSSWKKCSSSFTTWTQVENAKKEKEFPYTLSYYK